MNAVKKHLANKPQKKSNPASFPPEAYEYNDDITEAGVEEIRRRAASDIDFEEWEHVDGLNIPSGTRVGRAAPVRV